jgi:5-methylcytosine-specific restriction endonuclease McrA
MTTYLTKLNDPRWNKKHDQILKRDFFQCTVCGSKTNLQVHHTFYYKRYIDPWQYPDKSLLTVCRSCHKEWHEYNENKYIENPTIKRKGKKRLIIPRKPKKKKIKRLSLAELQTRIPKYKPRNITARI